MRYLIPIIFIGLLSPLCAELDCSKEVLLAYFPKAFVTETLKKYSVPEEQWAGIIQELTAKEEDVIRMVEERASKMDPDPLQDPQNRQEAVKLFRETLLQIFGGVLYAHGVTDDKQIKEMLDDIQQQKAKRFVQCMKSEKIQPHAAPERSNSDFDFEEE